MTKQTSNKIQKVDKCWIFNLKNANHDAKVRYHCYAKSKCRGFFQGDFNITLTLTNKILVRFHSL